jgi:hypothetical protein
MAGLWAGPAAAQWPQEAASFQAGKWQFTEAKGLPLPRTLIYAHLPLDGMERTAADWARNGFGGFLLHGVMAQWYSDIWATDGEPATMGEADRTFQQVKRLNEVCRKYGIDANFIDIAWSGILPDWWDDLAWAKFNNNFAQAAGFARDTGCRGLSLDIEYSGAQYSLDWPGYTYQGYTEKDLLAKIAARMTALAAAMFDAWPEMELAVLPGGPGIIVNPWIEEAAKRDAPGGVHFFDEGPYIRPNPTWVMARVWKVLSNTHDQLSPAAWEYFRRRCSVAPAAWPLGRDTGGGKDWLPHQGENSNYPPEEWRAQYAALLMTAPRYVWIYAPWDTWWGETPAEMERYTGRAAENPTLSPQLAEYRAVIREKQVLADPKMQQIAAALRRGELADYSEALGWMVQLQLDGPKDKLSQPLLPTDYVKASPMYQARAEIAKIAQARDRAEYLDVRSMFGLRTTWNLIGPFDNTDGRGMTTAYPPEKEIDLGASYPTANGRLRWFEYGGPEKMGSVDLTRVFYPKDNVVAYALAYITVKQDTPAQLRLGGNDQLIAWLGGEKVYERLYPGRALLDEAAAPVMLRQGTTRLLLKIGNSAADWGFYCRLTDEKGRPLENIGWSLRP